jgi:hypothetical protein
MITHTTVGYGDFYPISKTAKWVNTFHVAMVYGLLSGIISF